MSQMRAEAVNATDGEPLMRLVRAGNTFTLDASDVEGLIPQLQKWLRKASTLRERCDPFLAAIRSGARGLLNANRTDVETGRYACFAALERGEVELALQWVDALDAAVRAIGDEPTRATLTKAVAGLRRTIGAKS